MFLCEMMSGVLLALGDDKCQSVAPLFRNLASRGASHVKIQVIDAHRVFSCWVAHYFGVGTRLVCVRVLPMRGSTQQDSKIEREREIEGDRKRERQDKSNTIIWKAD